MRYRASAAFSQSRPAVEGGQGVSPGASACTTCEKTFKSAWSAQQEVMRRGTTIVHELMRDSSREKTDSPALIDAPESIAPDFSVIPADEYREAFLDVLAAAPDGLPGICREHFEAR